MSTLAALLARQTAIENAIDDAIALGEQYQITGSHANTQQTLKNLRAELHRVQRQLHRWAGYPPRSQPSYD